MLLGGLCKHVLSARCLPVVAKMQAANSGSFSRRLRADFQFLLCITTTVFKAGLIIGSTFKSSSSQMGPQTAYRGSDLDNCFRSSARKNQRGQGINGVLRGRGWQAENCRVCRLR